MTNIQEPETKCVSCGRWTTTQDEGGEYRCPRTWCQLRRHVEHGFVDETEFRIEDHPDADIEDLKLAVKFYREKWFGEDAEPVKLDYS